MARRHDRDAGGPAEVLAAKAHLREQVWSDLRERRLARFPGARGRIPNFVGAEAAAELLRGTEVWRRARTLKCNPDAAQWPVRQRALQDGKVVYMAVPRLGKGGGFSDLEFALATEAGLISPDTLVVTTVHERQLVESGTIPTVAHDARINLIVTPERMLECPRGPQERARIRWEELTEDKVAAIPLLGQLRSGR